jgi:hypothetical protein
MADDLAGTIRDVWNRLTFNDPNVKKAKEEAAEEEKKKKVASKDPDPALDRDDYTKKKIKEAGG